MKETFIFEGKKFISSKRASDISEYSSDYIGQLCRAQKLDCRMLGRSWFVTEESLSAHQKKVAADEAVRNRIANIYGDKVSSIDSNSRSNDIEDTHSEKIAVKIFDEIKLKYESDDRPLLPSFEKIVDQNNSKQYEVESNDVPIIPVTPVNHSIKVKNIYEPVSNIISYQAPVKSYPELTRKIILRRVIGVLSIAMIFVLGVTFTLFDRNSSVVANSNQNVAGVFSVIADGLNNFSSGIRNIFAGFKGDYVATKVSTEQERVINNIPYSDENGIVVVPSTGIHSSDELIKMKIEQSFSDMVDIQLDENGNSGTVTPIFRESKGEDFMYVMVPVKDGNTP